MAKKPTTSQDNRDELPSLDDDNEQVDTLDARADAGADGVGDDDPVESVEAEKPLSARDLIVQRYRERRAAEEAEARGLEADESDESDDDDGDDAEPVAAKAKEPPAASEPDDEPEFTLLVDGKPVKMKQSEVVAKAQIAVASDSRLDEAKRILSEAKALAQRGHRDDGEHQPDDDDDLNAQDDRTQDETGQANQPGLKLDRERLKEVVQRLQVGDEEEGLEALAEFAELVGASKQAQGLKPDEIGRVVSEQLARAQVRGEMEQAAVAFRTKYESVATDPELLEITFSRMRNEMRQDLVTAGLDAEQLNGLDSERLLQMHQEARMRGQKVRDYSSMFDKIGSDVSAKYGVAARSQDTSNPSPTQNGQSRQARLDRKRAGTSQPRTAGVRTTPPQQPQRRTPADVIAQMKQQRGF